MSEIETHQSFGNLGFYYRHPFISIYNYYRYACAPFKVRGVVGMYDNGAVRINYTGNR
jgi:hypothetical protein